MPRGVEAFLTIAFFLLFLPVFIIISLLILFLGGGWPILFKQRRVGKNGNVFYLFKFRTMYPGAEDDQEKYRHLNEADGPVFKIKSDPRYTRIGRFLAHTGLDELPQLINIIRGEMSIVGPRPLPVKEASTLEDWQKKREKAKPGIISPWLFNGYHDSSFDKWMKLDIDYVNTSNFVYDLKLILRGIRLAGGLIKREIISLILDKGNQNGLS